MKNKAEKLYLYLSETDDELLREAEMTDTREKLLRENEPAPVPVQHKPRRFKTWKVASAIAACAAVAFLLHFFLPFGGNPNPGGIKINSLDELNYYGARMLASRSTADGMTKQSGALLGDRKGGAKSGEAPASAPETDGEVRYDIEEYDGEEHGEEENDVKYDEENGYYYYEFDPNDTFSVLGARGFCIRLSDPNGFLAQKLGTGLIDVVLTSNSFEDMITFRSQDGKYYSCLSGNSREGYLQYGDFKYVDGFRVVKNEIQSGETNGYTFSVRIEDGVPVGFESSYYFEQIGNEIPLDNAEFVEGSGYFVASEESFTVAELEEFANSLPAKEE